MNIKQKKKDIQFKTFEEYSAMADLINNMLGIPQPKDDFLSRMGISTIKKKV